MALNFVESILAGIASNYIYNMHLDDKYMLAIGILLFLAYKNRIKILRIIRKSWNSICTFWININLYEEDDKCNEKLRSLVSPNNLMQYITISYGISIHIFQIIGLAMVYYCDWLKPLNSVISYTVLISIFVFINIVVMKGITECVKYKYYRDNKVK